MFFSELSRPSSPVFTHFHPSYRSLVFSISNRHELSVQCDQGTPEPFASVSGKKDRYFTWVQEELKLFADRLGRPWCIINGDFFLHNDWQPTPAELLILKEKGLYIFNHEPEFFYNSSGTWPWVHSKPPRFFALERLSRFLAKYEIAPAVVFLCENGLSEKLNASRLFNNLQFKDWSSYFFHTVSHERKIAQCPPIEPISKKLLCPNFRYEAIRELLVGYLVGQRHHYDSYLSFFHSHVRSEMNARLPFKAKKLQQWPIILDGIKRMQGHLPFTIETTAPKKMNPALEGIPDMFGSNHRSHYSLRMNFAPSAFVYVYCESRPFSFCSEISEKTLDPIFSKRPFLPFAAPFFLKEMRSMGFKTFGEFWDESFDEILDPALRFERFLSTVDSIASKTIPELQALDFKIRTVLEHNYAWAHKGVLEQELTRLFTVASN